MRFNRFRLLLAVVTICCCGCASQKVVHAQSTPEWAKYAVWYQIFPERFANGDAGNDPTPLDMADSWPYCVSENWQVHPWTSDWYQLQPWEKEIRWEAYFDWAKPGAPNHNIHAGNRRYGGDLRGVLDRLDYLQSLGVTAIYFNPLFEAPSLHKYDATMYHHIDNNFGPNPDKDREIWQSENPADPRTWQWTTADSLFLALIKACHARGMKVIIDGVFNHTGNTFWAFRDVQQRGPQSPYRDWYYINEWDNPSTPENEFSYTGWAGISDLPELREDENGLIAPVRAHLHDVVKRWMDPDGDGDPSDGIDGWRLDVAEKVNIAFWREFRQWVKQINPDAVIIGEIWWEDWPNNKMFNAAPWFDGAFDGVMNYRVGQAIKHFAIDRRNGVNAAGFADSLKRIIRDYPQENLLACMNLMDSHDTDRLASQIVNPDRWFDHGANPAQNPHYNARKPDDSAYQIQKLVAGIQMALPGAPMIFYGDEAGMWGGDDPDCRKPMLWPELQYDPEVFNFDGSTHAPDNIKFNNDMFRYYQQLIRIRKQYPVLATGSLKFIDLPDSPKVAVFMRSTGDAEFVVVANAAAQPATIAMRLITERYASNVLDVKDVLISPDDQLRLRPYEVAWLRLIDF